MSSTSSYPSFLTVEKKGAVAHVTLKREPVNSMNLEVWSSLLQSLTDLENDAKIRAVIYNSGLEREVFTAGNDINELYSKNTNQVRHKQFWTAQTTFLTRLYSSRLFTVAAIKGACPAGGCVFALCCDYRVMVDNDKYGIGLNEVALGIPVPRFWIQLFARTVGHNHAEKLLLTATMPSPKEALRIGLIDRLVSAFDLISVSESVVASYLRYPDSGRVFTKLQLRQQLSDDWQAYSDEEAALGWAGLESPETTKALGKVLERLQQASKPKPKL